MISELLSIVSTFSQVVQVYMSFTNTSVPIPERQLVGFSRESLAKGEDRSVSFDISGEQMSVWMSDSTGWGILTGRYIH